MGTTIKNIGYSIDIEAVRELFPYSTDEEIIKLVANDDLIETTGDNIEL